MKKLLKLNPKYFTFLIIFIASFFAIFEPKNAGAAHANQFNSNLENYNNKLQIFDKKHKIAEFKIAIANSDKKRAIGLMNLDHLPQNHGMLFIFEKNQIHRIENRTDQNLQIIEVQSGKYLSEDDIERLKDDYHRK